MSAARYFIPEHPKLTDVYSKAELRAMLQAGHLSRSDMVTDDESGIAYLLGDLLAVPFPEAGSMPARTTTPLQTAPPRVHEFRADTPLPRTEHEEADEDEDENENEDEGVEGYEDDGGEEEEADEDRRGQEREQDKGEEMERDRTFAPPSVERSRARPEPMASIEDEDQEEEELLYVGHPSWLAFPKALFVAAVCTGAAVYFQQHHVGFEWITLLGSIAGLIVLFIGLDRTTTTYFVTSKRVEMEFGIIGRNTKEVRICDIRAIDVTQRGFDAVVGLGTVKFDSSASAGPEVVFKNVRRPHDLKQLVRELQG